MLAWSLGAFGSSKIVAQQRPGIARAAPRAKSDARVAAMHPHRDLRGPCAGKHLALM
jgi:hypothetical protein